MPTVAGPAARSAEGVAGRADLRLPRATASTASSARSRRADDQPAVHPVPARGDERLPGRRLRQVQRPARRVHGHVGPGRDPPAQRPVRRQARPRAGRGDRRPDQPHRHGRQLPAGGRPAQPVQGRRQRLRADGDRPGAAAQRPRPGDPDRDGPARADGDDHPQRRPGARLRAAARTSSRWCPPASASPGPGHRPTTTASTRAAEILNAGSKVAILVGQGARGARAEVDAGRRAPRRRRRQGAARQGRPQRRAAVRHRLDRPARHPAQLRDDARLRHPADHRLELPLHPVPAGVRPGPRRPDRHRRRDDRDALPLRGQPRRRRRRPRCGR